MLSPAVTNIAVMLVMMQLSRKIDMEDETNILYIRIAYVSCTVLGFLIYQLVRRKIVATNDLTKLKIVKPKNAMKPNEPEQVEYTTVRDYDLTEIDSAIKSIFTGVAMMGFMHLYMKYTNPLFMQCINPIKSALEHNETKIHLFGNAATGELKRPFKTPSLLDGFMGKPATDAADASKPKIEEISSAEGVKTE
ncbi:Snd3p KNAG_0B01530 [Huiozyma naganishii CBS 8797]|uniref:Uncharacterized protein n=1 Tax=Huiozyma naganishii (strain ATCC MYA-139 / BCRC 22969 / CBS 8797 / KCTC 17520 / NBRC 10181 / NCYC 3082 / Yp74L-3) TaxID=1071383 RepID=J7R1C2_HUIN7|nr:hypothetical protein KNAG_0B01530 [Kazachstania naganishii CBS 8797]CCK68600.1 hypothetical protein KNAG_0B01530 [Kazachstania naganishii CBS 8797]